MLISVFSDAQNWVQSNSFPGTERDDGIAFTIDNKAYCGTGLLPWFAASADFYVLDMTTDLWSTIASLPAGKERQYACAFSTANKGFVFGGKNENGIYFNNVWQYEVSTNSWTEKTALPSLGRAGAACFVIDSIAYIISGETSLSSATNEVWAYNMVNDTWVQKNNLPFDGLWRASAASYANFGYLIFGKNQTNNYNNQLVQYSNTSDNWTQLSTFPMIGRTYTTMQNLNDNLLLIGGVDSLGNFYNDMWSYNLTSSQWSQLSSIPSSQRKGGVCFNNGSSIYYSTGITNNNVRLNETWKCNNPTALEEQNLISKITFYPNPVKENIVLNVANFNQYKSVKYNLYNELGEHIFSQIISNNQTTIFLNGLVSGLYIIKINADEEQAILKFIKY